MQSNRRFIVLVTGLITVSIFLGIFLGDLSVPKYVPSELFIETQAPEETGEDIQLRHDTRIHVSIAPGSHIPSVLKELQYAVESDVYSFVLSTPLPVSEADNSHLIQTLKLIQGLDEEITISLALNCNPPASWLREHSNDTSTNKQDGMAYPSIGSDAWSLWAATQLAALLHTLLPYMDSGYLNGVVLEALENGHWVREKSYDQSSVHTLAFQGWLAKKYGDIEALQEFWKDEGISEWSDVSVPVQVALEAIEPVMYTFSEGAAFIDYHRFLNDSTASTINELARVVKDNTPESFTVHVSYGNVFEYSDAASGNWGLSALDFTAIDGLVTFPLSQEKGMGRHAFFAAPPYAETHWISMDPVYTGIRYEKETDTIEVPGTYQPKQIDHLMARNAAIASLYHVTWAWSDPQGQGTLAHPPLWAHFRKTLALRSTLRALSDEASATVNIVVVVDETSMAYVRDDDFIQTVFASLQDSISHAGIDVQWTTMHEFLTKELAATAPVYLFPNLFQVSEERRKAIHAKLAFLAKRALDEEFDPKEVTVVWLYAPGYVQDDAQADHVTALTGVKTELREAGSKAGSVFSFSGNWIEKDQEFGKDRTVSLLLKSVDDQVDPLARYRDDDTISVAMKYLESGWISIVHYDPTLTPEFLHDLLYILEVPVRLPEISMKSPMVLYTNSQFSMIHARDDSTLSLEFDTAYDINNLLNLEQGWSHSRSIELTLGAGETAILDFKE